MKFLKKYLGGLIVALGIGTVMALNFDWTSFIKVGNPVAQPQTAFYSGGCVSNASGACSSTGKYWTGTQIMVVENSGVQVFVPLLDAAGNAYSTGAGGGGGAGTGRAASSSNIYNTNTGNVGIGTNAPTSKLTVSGNIETLGTTSTLFVPQSVAGVGRIIIQAKDAANATNLFLYPGTTASNTYIGLSNSGANPSGSMNFWFGGGFAGAPSGTWAFGSTVNQLTSSPSLPIAFVVSNATNGRIEAMRIINSGYVGIGTTTPTAALQVSGTIIVGNTTIASSAISSNSSHLTVGSTQAGTNLNLNGVNSINFTITSASKMLLDANGNFGIGTTTPTQALDVSGSVNAKRMILPDTEGGTNAGYFSNTSPASFGGPIITFAPMANNKYTQFVIASSGAATTPVQAGLGASDNQMTFQIGVERVDAAGQAVGANVLGSIASIGTAYPIRFGNRPTNSAFTEYMRIFTGGTVAIGPSGINPNLVIGTYPTMLSVNATSVFGAGTMGASIGIGQWSNNVNTPILVSQKSRGATVGSYVATQSSDGLFQWDFNGVNSSNSVAIGARIGVFQDGSAGATYIPGTIYFSTSDGAAAIAERMRITNAGSVGIGTATPYVYAGTRLHTNYDGAALNLNLFTQYSTDTTNSPNFYFAKGGGTQASPLAAQTGYILGDLSFAGQYDTTLNHVTRTAFIRGLAEGSYSVSSAPASLIFATTPPGSATPTEKLRIDGDGRIYAGGLTLPSTSPNAYFFGFPSANGYGMSYSRASSDYNMIGFNSYLDASVQPRAFTTGAATRIFVQNNGRTSFGYAASVNKGAAQSFLTDFNIEPLKGIGIMGQATTTMSIPTMAIDIHGGVAQSIGMSKNPTAGGFGNDLTVMAGGAYSGGLNLNGGNLNLYSGLPTGSGSSYISFFTYPLGTSGTTPGVIFEAMRIGINGLRESTDNTFTTRAGSGLARDDVQNLQVWDTDTVAQKPTLATISGSTIKTRCFDGGTQMNEIFGNFEIPHDMYTGTGAVLSPHVHWMGSTTAAATGIWYIDYTIRKVNAVYTATTTISQSVFNITGRQANLTEVNGDIPATGVYLGDTVSFRLYRDPTGSDTYAGTMCLSQIGFHYQRDTLGSRQEYVK